MMPTSDWNCSGDLDKISKGILGLSPSSELAHRTLALANLQPGKRVLDINCGTGEPSRAIAKKTRRSGDVIGLDDDPVMLNLARQQTGREIPPIEWRECSAGSLHFENAIFDVVFYRPGRSLKSDQSVELKEAHRVLKPGGCLLMVMWGVVDLHRGQKAIGRTWEILFSPQQDALHCRSSSCAPEKLRLLLEQIGFRQIYIELDPGGARSISVEQFHSRGVMPDKLPTGEKYHTALIRELTLLKQTHTATLGLCYPIETLFAKATS